MGSKLKVRVRARVRVRIMDSKLQARPTSKTSKPASTRRKHEHQARTNEHHKQTTKMIREVCTRSLHEKQTASCNQEQ
jgi:hypothetical protein